MLVSEFEKRIKNIDNHLYAAKQKEYPDARPGDSTNAGFWFNYCPMCGRKLAEAQHE